MKLEWLHSKDMLYIVDNMPKFQTKHQFDVVGFSAFYIAAASIGLIYFIPEWQQFMSPLHLFGTLAHELGHGYAAIFVGGEFETFIITEKLGGLARYSGVHSSWAKSFVSACGILAPALLGIIIIYLSRKYELNRTILFILSFGISGSVFIWLDGEQWAAQLYQLAIIFFLPICAPSLLRAVTVQFIGLSLCLQTVLSYDYALTDKVTINNKEYDADMQIIANHLGGDFRIYGWAIIITTTIMLLFALWHSAIRIRK